MVKLELLSPNILLLLNNLAGSQNLAKYLYYDTETPLSEPNIGDTSILFKTKLFPYSFDPDSELEDCSQLRVYFFDGDMTVGVDDVRIFFDIVVAKSLWLINNGNPAIRPYEIMVEIGKILDGKSIGTLGTIHLQTFRHMPVNKQFDSIRLIARMKTFNSN